ncbi:MAG: hypothetical protein QXT69_06485 [Fervidicoccaceae archaeon]
MMSPFLIAYRYVLPSIRRYLVIELARRGRSEYDIAKMLGISVSAASRYINGRRGALLNLESDDMTRKEIERLASELEKGKDVDVEEKLHIIAASLLSRKVLCPFHYEMDPSPPPANCSVCSTLFAK